MQTLNPQSASGPLSPIQLELLKLYGTGMTDDEVRDLKRELSRYFAQKTIEAADREWDQHGLSDETMDRWLNA